MLRHLPTPLGLGLIIAGLSLITSPRIVILVVAGVGALFALIVAVAFVRSRRSGNAPTGAGRTASEEASAWQQFTARRRRAAPWESAFYLLIAGGLIWLEGLTLGTILIAAGIGSLLIARWFVEPRTWAEVTRRLATPRT
jgi:hypothetical protein